MTTQTTPIGRRAQAISECRLIDVTPAAFAAGFRCSVAITNRAWQTIRAIPARYRQRESFNQRLDDVLTSARYAVRQQGAISDEVLIIADLHIDEGNSQVFAVTLESGDDGRTAATIALGDE